MTVDRFGYDEKLKITAVKLSYIKRKPSRSWLPNSASRKVRFTDGGDATSIFVRMKIHTLITQRNLTNEKYPVYNGGRNLSRDTSILKRVASIRIFFGKAK